MEDESPKPASRSTAAPFLSYASQGKETARRIFEALRATGTAVWFDQSERRGGDGWDRQIRRQIHDRALFLRLISQPSETLEGCLRLERLAVGTATARPYSRRRVCQSES
jgi:hypothetical protein